MNLSYFKTLAEANGYIIEDIPWVGYVKETDQVLYCSAANKMVIINNNQAEIINKVGVIFETLNDADEYIIETVPFSCYIKENQQLLECNQENCKIVVENGVAVIKERSNIIRYTATSEVTPYNLSYLPTIISNDFDSNTGEGVIKFAEDVTSIGNYTFYGCSSLASITIPNSVTSIGYGAFYNCSSLTSIEIPNSVTSIGELAFTSCSSLTYITIPNSVTNIGKDAFIWCAGLTSIEIPNSVTSIGSGAFEGCSVGLTSIIVNDENTKYDSRNECNAIIETDSNKLILGCQNTIIPNTVTSIGYGAFRGCNSLTSITIPNSVTSIEEIAFYECSSLTSVTIPNSVTYIGANAFSYCRGLASITCEAITPPTIQSNAWYNVPISTPLYVPAGSESDYANANYWSQFTNIQGINI